MPNQSLTYLLLAAIDGQDADLSDFSKQQINDGLTALVDQGYAVGKPIKRVGDPKSYYSVRGLRLTSLGERRLESLLDQM